MRMPNGAAIGLSGWRLWYRSTRPDNCALSPTFHFFLIADKGLIRCHGRLFILVFLHLIGQGHLKTIAFRAMTSLSLRSQDKDRLAPG